MIKYTVEETHELMRFLEKRGPNYEMYTQPDWNEVAVRDFEEIMLAILYKSEEGLAEIIYNFCNDEPLETMPLFINHPGYGPYAKWRLFIGK